MREESKPKVKKTSVASEEKPTNTPSNSAAQGEENVTQSDKSKESSKKSQEQVRTDAKLSRFNFIS